MSSATSKPRVLMLADRPGWAFDVTAQAISRRLGDEFEFRVEYAELAPDLSECAFDLYVFFWGETYHQRYVDDPRRVLKEISSHRWQDDHWGRLTAAQAVEKYLSDAGTLLTPSKRLQTIFAPYRRVRHIQKGFEPSEFPPSHLVGLICPADMRHSTYAENERSKYEVPEP
ncbi:MAG: hypothetical protein M1274_08840 [Actinobacteria bacterium]|nr:hypothetical protein [Actinomycetota bacterium]